LRKIVAFSLGFFIIYSVGYLTLHSSFLMLSDWLGPVLGDGLLSALTVIYILLGSPVRFAVLGLSWILVGLLGGMIIRRRLGAVLTMLMVFFIFVPALAISVAGIGLQISEMNFDGDNPFDILPPLPQGLSMAAFFEAPIIGEVFQTVMDVMEGGIPSGPIFDLVIQMASPLALDLTLKPLLLIIAALVGVELGKLVEPFFNPYSEAIRKSLGGKPRVQPILIILTIILGSLSTCGFAVEEKLFGEAIVGYIDEQGQVFMGDLFLDSEVSIGGIQWGSPATEGLLASILVTHEGFMDDFDLGDITMGFDLSSMISVMPSTLMVVVYMDVPLELAESRADTISSAFSSSMDIGISKLFAFSPQIPMENMTELPNISLVIYESSATLEDIGGSYFEPFIHHEGLVEIIEDAIDDSTLIPEATSDSVTGSAFITGFISPQILIEEMIENGLYSMDNGSEPMDELLALIDGPVGFTGGFASWENGYKITDDGYYFDLPELLGYTEEHVILSEDADISAIGVFGPTEDEEQNGFTAVSIPEDAVSGVEENLSTMGSLEVLSTGGSTLSENFRLFFGGSTLPLLVKVTKTVTPEIIGREGSVTVNVLVENRDIDAMSAVELNDEESLRGYSPSARIVSGITSGYWSSILPGASESISYTIELGDLGVYTLQKAHLNYQHGDNEYSKQSNSIEVTVTRPNAISFTLASYSSWWGDAGRLLDIPTGGSGSTTLLGIGAIIVGILAFLEVMNIRKWLQG